jgi:hypothetical protein
LRLLTLSVTAAIGLYVVSCAPREQPEEKAVANGFKPYGVEHATLNFEYGGMTRGTETLWIDSFGLAEARMIHSEQITEEGFRPRKNYSIKSGASVTIIDSGLGKAFHFTEPLIDSLLKLPAGSVPSSEEQFKRYFAQIGYTHIGDTVLAGLPSQIWKQRDVPNYLFSWRAIIVGKHTDTPAGPIDLVLRSVDTTSPIDRARFIVPAGLPILPEPPRR